MSVVQQVGCWVFSDAACHSCLACSSAIGADLALAGGLHVPASGAAEEVSGVCGGLCPGLLCSTRQQPEPGVSAAQCGWPLQAAGLLGIRLVGRCSLCRPTAKCPQALSTCFVHGVGA